MSIHNSYVTFALTMSTSILLSGQVLAGNVNSSVGVLNVAPGIHGVYLKDKSRMNSTLYHQGHEYALNFTAADNNTFGDINNARVSLDYSMPSETLRTGFVYNQTTNSWIDPNGYLLYASKPNATDMNKASYTFGLFFIIDEKAKKNKNVSINITVTDDAGAWAGFYYSWKFSQDLPAGDIGGGGGGGYYTNPARSLEIPNPTLPATTPPVTTSPPTTQVASTTTPATTTPPTTQPPALFDVLLSIPEESQTVATGKNLSATISLFNLGRPGKTNVRLKYQVTDAQGNVVLEDQDEMIVETQSSFLREFALKGLGQGDYTLHAMLLYENATASASAGFRVTGESAIIPGAGPDISLYAGALVLILIAVLAWKTRGTSLKGRVHEIIRRRYK